MNDQDHTPGPRDFARIERASDGAQVLFFKGTDDDGKPCLFQMTECQGFYAELNMSFTDDDKGWEMLDRAFDKTTQANADAVRGAIKKATGES